MPPSAADPRQLLVVLNPVRRKALYNLSNEIVSHMRSQLELEEDDDTGPLPDNWSDDDTLYEGEGRASDRAPRLPPRPGTKTTPPGQKLVTLRLDALEFLNKWAAEFLKSLKEIVLAQEDANVLDGRKKRLEKLANAPEPSFYGDDLMGFDEAGNAERPDIARLNSLYKPTQTRLATLSFHDRKDVLGCVLLLLLANGSYSAHSRIFLLYLTSSLKLPISLLMSEETEVAKSLLMASSEAEKKQAAMTAETEAEKRRQDGQTGRFWKVGLASVAGAAVIGITGGLAAPVVAGAIGGLMGTLGLGTVASFLGVFWMNSALVGALFGAFGAKMTGEMMDNYAKEVEDFCFIPLRESSSEPEAARHEEQSRRLRVTVGINGWLTSEDDITKPWKGLGDDSEVFALRYEMDKLLSLGKALESVVSNYAWKSFKMEILRRTVLASLWAALWPAYVVSLATNLDNPFNLARNRSEKAGEVLADALINKVQGERPVTLVGYSLGARVIYTCLRSLAERKAFGLIDTVVLIGAPAPSDVPRWQKLRSVVAGQIFNVYTENDYILGFLYRTHSLQLGVAGLQPIKRVRGVQNLDLSAEVSGHLRYPELTSQILARCGFANVSGGDRPIEREADLSVVGTEKSGEGDVGELIQLGDASEPKSLATPGSSALLRELSGSNGPESARHAGTASRKAPSIQPDLDTAPAPPLPPRPPRQTLTSDTAPSSRDQTSTPVASSTASMLATPPSKAPSVQSDLDMAPAPLLPHRPPRQTLTSDTTPSSRDQASTLTTPSTSADEPPKNTTSSSSRARSLQVPLRQMPSDHTQVTVVEPKSLAEDVAGNRPGAVNMAPSPLSDSYSATLAVCDGAGADGAGDEGGIRMVSYDSE